MRPNHLKSLRLGLEEQLAARRQGVPAAPDCLRMLLSTTRTLINDALLVEWFSVLLNTIDQHWLAADLPQTPVHRAIRFALRNAKAGDADGLELLRRLAEDTARASHNDWIDAYCMSLHATLVVREQYLAAAVNN